MLGKQSPLFPRNLTLGIFGKLLEVFSTKINLLYLLYLFNRLTLYELAELFNISERVLFSRLLEGFIGGPIFKNVGERSTAKNYCSISLLSLVSKVFEEPVNKRVVDHLENCGLFF